MPKTRNQSKRSPAASPVKDKATSPGKHSDEDDDFSSFDLSWPERMLRGDGDKSVQSDTSYLSSPNNTSCLSYQEHNLSATSQPTSLSTKFDDIHGRPGIYDHLKTLSQEEKPKAVPEKKENKQHFEILFDYFGLHHSHGYIGLVFLCLLIVIFLIRCVPADNAQPKLYTTESRVSMVKDFDQNFQSVVVERFPKQDKRFWKIIRAACKGVLREAQPSQPAVIMLASHQDHSRTAECIARHVTQVFSDTYAGARAPQMLSSHDYARFRDSSDGLKRHIDRSVRAAFDGSSRAIHVSEIQRIPGRAAAMFHAFCDNDNAPYKDAAIVFTVHSDERIASEHALEEYLTEIWGNDLDVDTLTPLLSRMANSIALVQGEDEAVLDKYC